MADNCSECGKVISHCEHNVNDGYCDDCDYKVKKGLINKKDTSLEKSEPK